MMKNLILIASLFSLPHCSQAKKPQPMENQTTKNNPYYSQTNKARLTVSNAEWKKILPSDLYYVAREADTERPFTGKYNNFDEIGEYYCAVCGNHLFRSSSKFASTCGWPSFYEADKEGVIYRRDSSHGMERTEVLCKRCESHLGHVFTDGPAPTGNRFCMNSVCLVFERDQK